MATRISRADRYHGEVAQMEAEAFGAHHHHHITHNAEPRSKGPYRVEHLNRKDKRSPEASLRAKESSGSASKRTSKKKYGKNHYHPGD